MNMYRRLRAVSYQVSGRPRRILVFPPSRPANISWISPLSRDVGGALSLVHGT